MTILEATTRRKSMNLKESHIYIGGGGYPYTCGFGVSRTNPAALAGQFASIEATDLIAFAVAHFYFSRFSGQKRMSSPQTT